MKMMNGYDREEALTFMKGRIDRKAHAALSDKIDDLLGQCIDADMDFMFRTGVLDEDGNGGENYYEDDDAIEFMVDAIVSSTKLTAEQAVKVAALVDDYMDLQQDYLESKGLVEWE